MKVELTTQEDLDRISQWTEADEYHRENNLPSWWLTGQGNLSFRLDDDEGPILYARLDDGEMFRFHCQFAPQNVVSKRRLIVGIFGVFPLLVDYVKSKGAKGIVFSSVSPKLVRFMKKLKFEPSWEHHGDYELKFEEN